MAYKQPSVPPMKEGEGAGLAEYIRELVLFLKDFSLETWVAVRGLQGVKLPEGVTQETMQEMLAAQAQTLREEMAAQAEQTAQDIEEAKAAATKEAIDSALPVGVVVKFANETDPNALYPWQTWTQITDGRVEIAANSTYPLGRTGGAATHTLTSAQLPSISGAIIAGSGNTGASAGGYGAFRSASGVFAAANVRQYGAPGSDASTAWPSGDAYERVTMSFGGGAAHNNMQPYIARNFWQRTA